MIRASLLDSDYRTSFTDGRSTCIADMPVAKGGRGQGFGPHDLIEAGLASCMAITARKYAQDHQIPLVAAECEVSIDRSDADSAVFEYRLVLQGNLTPAQDRQLREAIAHCQVARTLIGATRLRPAD